MPAMYHVSSVRQTHRRRSTPPNMRHEKLIFGGRSIPASPRKCLKMSPEQVEKYFAKLSGYIDTGLLKVFFVKDSGKSEVVWPARAQGLPHMAGKVVEDKPKAKPEPPKEKPKKKPAEPPADDRPPKEVLLEAKKDDLVEMAEFHKIEVDGTLKKDYLAALLKHFGYEED